MNTWGSFVDTYDYMGSVVKDALKAHVYRLIVYKGAMKNPSGHMGFTYPIQTDYLFEKGLQTLTD